MKKSFKKAGAAVLSMAMLLSMGAISMPVYAVPDSDLGTNVGKPAQVTVKITGLSPNAYHQGEGDAHSTLHNGDGPDAVDVDNKWATSNHSGTYTEKYSYLNLGNVDDDFFKTIESADVTMYRIARLDNGKGWDWEDYIKTAINNEQIPGFTDFATLLANKDGRDKITEGANQNTSDITGELEFTTPSEKLQQMASYFERLIDAKEKNVADLKKTYDEKFATSNNDDDAETAAAKTAWKNAEAALAAVRVGSATIDKDSVNPGVTLPEINPTALDINHDGVVSKEEAAKTQNVIGYYLIVTKTDQAGVLVQPVLVSLHNGEHKVVSVKGSTIKFEKTMTAIQSGTEYTETTTGTGDDAVTTKTYNNKGEDRFDSTAGENIKNGLVAKNDIVRYEIKSQLPQYDPNVKQGDITPFVITDTASNGITITAPTVTGETGDAAYNIDPDKFKVYLAKTENDLDNADARWELTGNTKKNVGDYQLTLGTAENKHGFTLTITGYQMVQEDTRWNVASTLPDRTAGEKYHEGDTPDKKPDQVQYIDNNNSALSAETMSQASIYDETKNKTDVTNMYNMYIKVVFEATVDKTKASADTNGDESLLGFDRSYDKFIDVKDVTAADITDLGTEEEINKQVLRVLLFGGETMYNQTYAAEDYAANSDLFPTETADKNALIDQLKAAGYNGGTAEKPKLNADNLFADDLTTAEGKEGQALRIIALLARDKKNIEMNGEYNTANVTYGNRYATGGGDAKMTTNYSKVYSVGLKLRKFIETLNVQALPEITNNQLAYAKFYEDNLKGKELSIPWTDSDGDPTSGTWTFNFDDLTASYADGSDGKKALESDTLKDVTFTKPTDVNGATAAQQAYFGTDTGALNATQLKVLAYYINQTNTERTAGGAKGIYAADGSKKKAVEGAVFHLTRISTANNDGTGDATVLEDLGYAVSTSNGDLYKLIGVDTTQTYASKSAAESAISDASSSHSGQVGIAFPIDSTHWCIGYVNGTKAADGTITYNPTTGDGKNDDTWDMLDIGYYEIEELYVPTGFKKWDKARFQIEAEKTEDDTYLETGSWTGAYSAKALGITKDETATKSHGLASVDETHAGSAPFLYYTNEADGTYYSNPTEAQKAHSDGVLQKDMYNEYLDELPATGGMGTVLFTAGGIAVILMAGALFVVYMKKRNEEEE